jgi:NADH:ubiquinone oxidoreductase subunit H
MLLFFINNLILLIKFSIIICLIGIDNDFFKFLPIILSLILSIAFLTLLERKILAAMQRRRGPNVIGIYGFLQAFADGVKLILKETIIPSSSNYIIFLLSPILIFSLSLYG